MPCCLPSLSESDRYKTRRKNSSFDWIYEKLVSTSSEYHNESSSGHSVSFGLSIKESSTEWSEEIALDCDSSNDLRTKVFQIQVLHDKRQLTLSCAASWSQRGILSMLVYINRQPQFIALNNSNYSLYIQGHPLSNSANGTAIAPRKKIQGDFAILVRLHYLQCFSNCL